MPIARKAVLVLGLSLSQAAAGQATHQADIWIVGPSLTEVHWWTTIRLEVWGQFESPAFIPGTSAMAGFGIDIENTLGGGEVSVSNVQIGGWAAAFGQTGQIDGSDITGVSGGQLANLFGILNPGIDTSNPIRLFTFDVEIDTPSAIHFQPVNPNINGGLSFYPDSTDGASIVAPNDPDSSLTLNGWSWVAPTPSGLGVFVLAGGLVRRRRGVA